MFVITTYKTSSGEITGTFYTSDEDDLILNVKQDESYIDGEYLPSEFIVVNGLPQRKSDDEILLIVNKKAMRSLRRKRQLDLSSSDWTQMPDAPLTDEKKQEWATYRQQLRDLPENTTDPSNPTWPTQPS
jgi:hypothetical protein